jgi:hypothetical protein
LPLKIRPRESELYDNTPKALTRVTTLCPAIVKTTMVKVFTSWKPGTLTQKR